MTEEQKEIVYGWFVDIYRHNPEDLFYFFAPLSHDLQNFDMTMVELVCDYRSNEATRMMIYTSRVFEDNEIELRKSIRRWIPVLTTARFRARPVRLVTNGAGAETMTIDVFMKRYCANLDKYVRGVNVVAVFGIPKKGNPLPLDFAPKIYSFLWGEPPRRIATQGKREPGVLERLDNDSGQPDEDATALAIALIRIDNELKTPISDDRRRQITDAIKRNQHKFVGETTSHRLVKMHNGEPNETYASTRVELHYVVNSLPRVRNIVADDQLMALMTPSYRSRRRDFSRLVGPPLFARVAGLLWADPSAPIPVPRWIMDRDGASRSARVSRAR
jgi:hypothetical protein